MTAEMPALVYLTCNTEYAHYNSPCETAEMGGLTPDANCSSAAVGVCNPPNCFLMSLGGAKDQFRKYRCVSFVSLAFCLVNTAGDVFENRDLCFAYQYSSGDKHAHHRRLFDQCRDCYIKVCFLCILGRFLSLLLLLL